MTVQKGTGGMDQPLWEKRRRLVHVEAQSMCMSIPLEDLNYSEARSRVPHPLLCYTLLYPGVQSLYGI